MKQRKSYAVLAAATAVMLLMTACSFSDKKETDRNESRTEAVTETDVTNKTESHSGDGSVGTEEGSTDITDESEGILESVGEELKDGAESMGEDLKDGAESMGEDLKNGTERMGNQETGGTDGTDQ